MEVGATAGLASDEAGDEVLDGRAVEEEEEGAELGGVAAVLEGASSPAPTASGRGPGGRFPAFFSLAAGLL